MSYENILTAFENNVTIITINRPTKLNALNRATIKELHKAFKAADEMEDMFPGRPTNPSRMYIPRCEYYSDNPPGDDWDGSWTMTSK